MKINSNSWHYKCLTESWVASKQGGNYVPYDACAYVKRLVYLFLVAALWGGGIGLAVGGLVTVPLSVRYDLTFFNLIGGASIVVGLVVYILLGMVLVLLGICAISTGLEYIAGKTPVRKKLSLVGEVYDSIKNKYCITLEFVDKENK